MGVNEKYVTKNEGQSMKAYVTKEKGPEKVYFDCSTSHELTADH